MYGLRLAGDIKICRKVRCCGVAGDGGWLSVGWVYRVAVHSNTRFGAQPLVIFSARGSSVGLVVFTSLLTQRTVSLFEACTTSRVA